jgi:phospholipase/lecithinase/hemolysin
MERSGCLVSASTLGTILLVILFFPTWKFRLIAEAKNVPVPAVFFFGDSYADTGNNDYISTSIKGNFPPYGRDFIHHIPTGRISNGKLIPDYIVEGLGVKDLLPPYLDPKLQDSDLITGVSFDSAGTGLDNITSTIQEVIPFWKEVDYFKEYKTRLIGLVGDKRANIILREAIYFIVIGANDFAVNYYKYPFRSAHFTVSQYTDFLLEIYASHIKELYSLNARKIGLINLPPLGCLPIERRNGECVEEINRAASGFNEGMNAMIEQLKPVLPGLKIVSLDYYAVILDFIQNPGKFGFQVTAKGCCFATDTETGFCKKFTPFTCADADKYVFFDSVHLSQKAYQVSANIFLRGQILRLL